MLEDSIDASTDITKKVISKKSPQRSENPK